MQEVRSLIFNDRIEEAERLFLDRMMGQPIHLQAYLPFCELNLAFPGHREVTRYRRELDLRRAVATVSYEADGCEYTREIFCSRPSGCLVIRLTGRTGTRKGPRNWSGSWEGPGLRFEGRLTAFCEGGSCVAGDGVLRIAEASAVTLVFSGATSFLNYRDMGGDPSELNNRYMARVSERPYRELLDEHVEDHKALYERVSIRLGGAGADERTGGKRRPTDRRVLDIRETEDPSLAALYFQFGRYLLIASSRPGDQPSNLQGIWNEEEWPEWPEDWDRPEDSNGHVSHLYGLYPGNQIYEDTPETFEGARKSLELRHRSKDRILAWPAAWRIALHARLRDGESARKRLVDLLAGSTNPNLLNQHEPFPMQIDANFGGTADIAEMLLQSRSRYRNGKAEYEIELLPALPETWPEGSVSGFRARGGFEVGMTWAEGSLIGAEIRSLCGMPCTLRYRKRSIRYTVKAGESFQFDPFSR